MDKPHNVALAICLLVEGWFTKDHLRDEIGLGHRAVKRVLAAIRDAGLPLDVQVGLSQSEPKMYHLSRRKAVRRSAAQANSPAERVAVLTWELMKRPMTKDDIGDLLQSTGRRMSLRSVNRYLGQIASSGVWLDAWGAEGTRRVYRILPVPCDAGSQGHRAKGDFLWELGKMLEDEPQAAPATSYHLFRIKSHKARDNVANIIGEQPWSFRHFDDSQHVYTLTSDEWAKVQDRGQHARWLASVKEIRRLPHPIREYSRTHSFGGSARDQVPLPPGLRKLFGVSEPEPSQMLEDEPEAPAPKPPSARKILTQAKRARVRFMDAEKRGENPYQATLNRIGAMAKLEKFAGTRHFLEELLGERPSARAEIQQLLDALDPQIQALGYAGPSRRLETPPVPVTPSRGYFEPADPSQEPGPLVADLPGVLLAKKWSGRGDVTCYWLSEKLDGVRAIWDGERFWSRNWNVFNAPAWFKKALPKNVVLDGELWAGRGRFRDAISTVRRKVPNDPQWRRITYEVFDAPMIDAIFEKRMRKLASLSKKWPDFVHLVPQRLCVGSDDLHEFHRQIAKEGGEGVMLRLEGSFYEPKRSSTLLKLKGFTDEEARIIAHEKGAGRHLGRLGSYKAELLSTGARFRVGTGLSDEQRENPLPVGTVITVRYQELTDRGIPRFPAFIGARDYE